MAWFIVNWNELKWSLYKQIFKGIFQENFLFYRDVISDPFYLAFYWLFRIFSYDTKIWKK